MKILAVGEIIKGDLRFVPFLKGFEIDWFNTIKTREHRFCLTETAKMVGKLRRGEYDLIISGKCPQPLFAPEKNLLSNILSLSW